MDHAGNNVFAGTALALDKHWNIGGSDLVQALTDGLHHLSTPKYHGLWRKLAQRLD
jgi:hypothetical protein